MKVLTSCYDKIKDYLGRVTLLIKFDIVFIFGYAIGDKGLTQGLYLGAIVSLALLILNWLAHDVFKLYDNID